MRACPFCAEEIQPAAVVCKHCGRAVKGVPVVTPPRRTWGWGWASAGLAVVALLGAMLLFPGGPEKNVAANQDAADALRETVRKAGQPCATVTRLYHQGNAADGTRYWNIACGAETFHVRIDADRTFEVKRCSPLTECFQPLR